MQDNKPLPNYRIQDTPRYRGMRHRLVEDLANKGITQDSVLHAIKKVPRHCFFDSALIEHAYQDKAFPIGEGQTISQPYTVAFQTQLLAVEHGDRLLEIGTGSGYQTCVLKELTSQVYTVEYEAVLFERARDLLRRMGYAVQFFHGDGGLGLPLFAPFDGILVTCACESIPVAWQDQLKVGGRIVAPMGSKHEQRMVRLSKKKDGTFVTETFQRFNFVPLQGKYGYK